MTSIMLHGKIAASKKLAFAAIFLLACCMHATAATTLLPNGEQCFQATTGINGMIGTLGSITGGTGYVSGTYTNVPLTGSGTLATANITVAGGAVTAVIILNPGKNYVAGDTLITSNTNLGGAGSGFSVPVASTAVNSSLAGGSVSMYVPNTTTPKTTWKDAGQVSANTNPIVLDANGCAVIYGLGQYRQQLLDSLGNLVWDQLTTDTSAQNSPFYAGLAGGSPNAITVIYPGFNGTDGSTINFVALNTNTGATTLNAIPILKATTGGLVALTGGEIVAFNPVSVIYLASGRFVLLNAVIPSTAASQAPLCGSTNLKMNVSNATQVFFTAQTVVMTSNAGLTHTRQNVSGTLTITNGNSGSPAVNGMDGEAPGTNTWLDVFAIDSDTGATPAPAVLGSLTNGNGQAPIMPPGYTYKCYLGAVFSTGAAQLRSSQQNGNRAQWIIGGQGLATSNSVLVMANGVAGTANGTAPVLVAQSVSLFVPPTASSIMVGVATQWKAGAGAQVYVAPNVAWGGVANDGVNGTLGAVWQCYFSADTSFVAAPTSGGACDLVLETSSIYWASSAAGGAIAAMGWTDAVNAN